MAATPMPPALPDPLAQYSFEAESPSRVQRMDSGRVRQIPKYTKSPRKARVAWFLTDDKLELFKAWHNVGLGGGTRKFGARLAFSGGVKYNIAYFLGDYKVSMDTHFGWRVDAELLVEDPA